MPFLTDDDYKAQIKDSTLATLIEGYSALRTDAEYKAMAQIKSRIGGNYDAAATFAKAGLERNIEVVMYMVDMTLYLLHSRISPGQVPELRSQRYQDAMEWLKGVASGDYTPDLPLKGDVDDDDVDDGAAVQHGSRPPRDTYF